MVYFVGAGPGAVDLITVRGHNILKNAECIIYTGSLVNKEILNIAPENCIIYNSANMTLNEVIKIIEENEKLNINTVRLHTGEPSIYGAVKEQYDILDKKNIEYSVVPGVSSMSAAAAAIKTEYTLPKISQSIIITRMEGRTSVPEKESIESFAQHNCTMVIFLSIHMIDNLVERLMKSYSFDTPASVVYRASWKDEFIIHGSLENIAQKVKENKITKTALIIVGKVLDCDYEFSKLYDSKFTHEYRKGNDDF